MTSAKKLITGIALFIIITGPTLIAEAADQTMAAKVSGGETHTLVLTANKSVWACGPNGGYDSEVGYYYGVLGIGSDDSTLIEQTLIRVHGPNDAGFLEDTNDIAAGWAHSLALDVNGFVWAWGNNYYGQLGDNQFSGQNSSIPLMVLSGEQEPNDPDSFLQHITAISAGRSGEHSLAVDANNFVWAWGGNEEGQLGNGQSGSGEKELAPVKVLGLNGQGRLLL